MFLVGPLELFICFWCKKSSFTTVTTYQSCVGAIGDVLLRKLALVPEQQVLYLSLHLELLAGEVGRRQQRQ